MAGDFLNVQAETLKVTTSGGQNEPLVRQDDSQKQAWLSAWESSLPWEASEQSLPEHETETEKPKASSKEGETMSSAEWLRVEAQQAALKSTVQASALNTQVQNQALGVGQVGGVAAAKSQSAVVGQQTNASTRSIGGSAGRGVQQSLTPNEVVSRLSVDARTALKAFNVHISFSEGRATLWLRDYKQEHTRELMEALKLLSSELSEQGVSIERVMVNGQQDNGLTELAARKNITV